jgi:hypothetical protein
LWTEEEGGASFFFAGIHCNHVFSIRCTLFLSRVLFEIELRTIHVTIASSNCRTHRFLSWPGEAGQVIITGRGNASCFLFAWHGAFQFWWCSLGESCILPFVQGGSLGNVFRVSRLRGRSLTSIKMSVEQKLDLKIEFLSLIQCEAMIHACRF